MFLGSLLCVSSSFGVKGQREGEKADAFASDGEGKEAQTPRSLLLRCRQLSNGFIPMGFVIGTCSTRAKRRTGG